MKNTIILLLLFLGICSSVEAQYLNEFPSTTNSLLWKLEGKKIKKDVYIFGTIHMIDKEHFYFPEQLTSIVASSEQIVLEIPGLNQMEAMKHMILTQGSAFDFFTKDQKDSILTWGAEILSMEKAQFEMAFNRMKPLVLMQLSMAKKMNSMESYDFYIQNIAQQNNIPLLGLERMEDQIAIFDNMDTLDIQNMIMAGIRDPEKAEQQLAKIVELYMNKNADLLYQYTVESEDDQSFQKYNVEFLDKRNMNWIPVIEQLAKKKKTFIAVGAGHLGGQNGILRLLEKAGYTLTPVTL